MDAIPDCQAVAAYLTDLQNALWEGLLTLDGGGQPTIDRWERPEGGGGESRAFADGRVFEKAGINFSHVHGRALPPSATARRPELEGRAYQAMGVSVVIHPRNPHAPTSHANIRFFTTRSDQGPAIWWFGGGFDLTPYYGYLEDAFHWHAVAESACRPFGADVYPRLKAWCDQYFYLKHRQEPRGIGGLFFDDYQEGGFDQAFAFARSVGDHYWPAYAPIVERRLATPYGEAERHWLSIRRGRYVEFNLVHDRGTLFGLQSGGRTESILISLPPEVRWAYQHQPDPGSPEARLLSDFLPARDWLAEREPTQQNPSP